MHQISPQWASTPKPCRLRLHFTNTSNAAHDDRKPHKWPEPRKSLGKKSFGLIPVYIFHQQLRLLITCNQEDLNTLLAEALLIKGFAFSNLISRVTEQNLWFIYTSTFVTQFLKWQQRGITPEMFESISNSQITPTLLFSRCFLGDFCRFYLYLSTLWAPQMNCFSPFDFHSLIVIRWRCSPSDPGMRCQPLHL